MELNYFARTLPEEKNESKRILSPLTDRIPQFGGKIPLYPLTLYYDNGRRTRQIRPTRQSERFQTRLSWYAQRRADGVLNPTEQSIREEILSGLLADKGGEQRISTAMHVLAEIMASDVSLLVTFNLAIDGVIQNNRKARTNPKALAQLDGYKRPLVSSLSGNLQRFGMERVAKVESRKSLLSSYYAHSWCPVSH